MLRLQTPVTPPSMTAGPGRLPVGCAGSDRPGTGDRGPLCWKTLGDGSAGHPRENPRLTALLIEARSLVPKRDQRLAQDLHVPAQP
jgi:hypothetical protein